MITKLKISSFLLCLTLKSFAVNYYVSKTGSDSLNSGLTINSPFLTIQKAATIALEGDNIYVREGVYREQIRPLHSGSEAKPITFQPYDNEKVTISGTELITGWVLHKGNIYKAAMPSNFMDARHNQSNQVFVNGQIITLAQWPNKQSSNPTNSNLYKAMCNKFVSKNRLGNVTTGEMLDEDLPAGDFVGAEIYFQPDFDAWSWVFTGKVIGTRNKNIIFQSYSNSGKDIPGQGVYDDRSRYVLFNKLSLLDTQEEWYHDNTLGVLFLQAPNNQNPENLIVEAKQREFAFDLSSRNFITIKGFNLFACSITTDIEAGGTNKGYNSLGGTIYPWRIRNFLANSRNCIIDGINAKYLTHYTDVSGHMFLQWGGSSGIVLSGSNHHIMNSTLQFSAGNGITLNGKNCKATNNTILDMNYMANDCAAVNTVGSQAITQDHEIAYNTINRTGRSGIAARNTVNSNPNNLIARIHHNDISNFMLQDWDGGGIYGVSETGSCNFLRIDHNIIHGGEGYMVSGIYFDYARNLIIDHNLIYNVEVAIKNQGTSLFDFFTNNALCYNNTLVVRSLDPKGYGPFGFGGGNTNNIGTIAQNNIIIYRDSNNTTPVFGYKNFTNDFGAGYNDALKITNFVQESGDPVFISFENRNFQLQANSKCIDAGTPVGVIMREGINVPPFNDATSGTVDIGAFEFGQPVWQAGTNNQIITPVQMINFTGKQTNLGKELSWTTLGETNNNLFEILKAKDGFKFIKIGSVQSKSKNGNSSEKLNYNFLDKDNKIESGYFKLNQIDFNGKSTLYDPIYIEASFNNNSDYMVYPNPVNKFLNVAISSEENTILNIILTDETGKIVHKKIEKAAKGISIIIISMENFKTGLYVLNVYEPLGKLIVSKKLIKN